MTPDDFIRDLYALVRAFEVRDMDERGAVWVEAAEDLARVVERFEQERGTLPEERTERPHPWAIAGERLARETAAAAFAAHAQGAEQHWRKTAGYWRKRFVDAEREAAAPHPWAIAGERLARETSAAATHALLEQHAREVAGMRAELAELGAAADRAERDLRAITAHPHPARSSTWHPSTACHSSNARSGLRPCSTAQPSSRASRTFERPKWPRQLGRHLHTRQVAATCQTLTSEQYSEHSPGRGQANRKGKRNMNNSDEFRPEVPGVPKEGSLTPSYQDAENKPARASQKSGSAISVPPGATEHPSRRPPAGPVSPAAEELPAALRRAARGLARLLLDWPSLIEHGGLFGEPSMLDEAERAWLMAAADRAREALELVSAVEAVVSLPPESTTAVPIELTRLGVTMPAWLICRHGHVALVRCAGLGGEFWFSLRTLRPVLWAPDNHPPALDAAALKEVLRG